MAKLKKYDLSGKVVGEVELDDSLFEGEANSQTIKDAVVAHLANKRQWNASTKTRSEVSRSGKKPRPQKGSGNARQGTRSATQYRGGGIAFGPRSKSDQHVKLNRKERRKVIKTLLSQKIKEDRLSFLEIKSLKEPKTKMVSEFLKKTDSMGRVLFVINEPEEVLGKSVRNIPKMDMVRAENLNAYILSLPGKVLVLDSATENLKNLLSA
jgi:large subunit ribosomal protein L4